MMTSNAGADRIAVERRRQIGEEGFHPAHDMAYKAGTLVSAAVVYALHALLGLRGGAGSFDLDDFAVTKASFWPWHDKWWKPKSPIRNLERAGALIAAEIDRIINTEGQAQNPALNSLSGEVPDRSEELWAAVTEACFQSQRATEAMTALHARYDDMESDLRRHAAAGVVFDPHGKPPEELWAMVRQACRVSSPPWRAYEVLHSQYNELDRKLSSFVRHYQGRALGRKRAAPEASE
jgi:hypothetical protein